MNKALQNALSVLTLFLVLAACQELTGPEGPQGEAGRDGQDAIVQDTAHAISAALETRTGGGEDEPWIVKVRGVDISDPDAFRHIMNGIVSGIEEGDIDLDLSECTGGFFANTGGVNRADKLRLAAITLPASLTHIIDGAAGSGAFHDYRRLARIRAPGLTYIGDYAFYSAGIAEGGGSALTELDFPEVLSVGAYAFYLSNPRSISLPKAASIGDYAFYGDSSSDDLLTEVNLPLALSIGTRAFNSHRNIAAINLPEVITIGDYAFQTPSPGMPNTALAVLYLPKAETIGGSAFANYTGLETLNLPEAREIGASAFRFSSSLEEINLPKVTSIGASAFAGGAADTTTARGPNTKLESLELPALTSIGNLAFSYCTALETFKLGPTVPTAPTTITTAANGIFLQTGDTGTINIQVPDAVKDDYAAAGWKAIAQNNNTTTGTIRFGTNHKEITVTPY